MSATPEKGQVTPQELLGQEALKRRFITPEQLRDALSEQAREVSSGRAKPRSLLNILISRGFLTTEQVTLLRESDQPQSGQDGSKYSVKDEIARGGMGAILRAEDRQIRRQVAMKVMLVAEDEKSRARFLEEAQVTGQLEHPNIVPVHELGVDKQGRPFFTMKLVKGRSLAEVLKALRDEPDKTREYTLPRLLNIFGNICNAIAFAHSRGVVHRDLKPANIMVGDYGEVLVMDWGLAKLGAAKVKTSLGQEEPEAANRSSNQKLEEMVKSLRHETAGSKTLDGALLGTPHYMPPEQAAGEIQKIDARSDIYSLGAILYEILTLKPPVEGKTLHALLKNVVEGKITPPEERTPERHVPRELSAVSMKALAKRPEDRYPSADALRRDIELYSEGRAVSAKPDSAWESLVKLAKRNKGASVALAAASLVLAGVVSVAFWINLREKHIAQGERDKSDASLAAFKKEQALRIEQQRSAAPALVEKARRAIDRKAFDPALKDVEIAAGFDPDHAEAQLLRGSLLVVTGKFEAAGAALEEFAIRFGARRPEDAADAKRLVEFCRLAREGKTGEAETGFSSILSKRGESALAETQIRSVTGRHQLYQQQIDRAWPGLGGGLTLGTDGHFAYIHRGGPVLTDLTPLKGIPLTRLDLAGAPEVINLSPLEGMPLKYIRLTNSKLRDLGPLKGMPLVEADFKESMVDDLRPLAGMPLKKLIIYSTPVSDLAPLAGMPLSELLIARCTNVSDLSPLKGAPLTRLDIASTAVADLDPLRGMALEDLNCTGTRIFDLAPLRGMPLKRLSVHATPVKDFSILKELPLEELNVMETAFADLNLLKGMALSSLSVWSNLVTDISPLRDLPLQRLALLGTPVWDLSPLKGKMLSDLNIQDSKVKSLEPLRGMPLTTLYMGRTEVSDLTPLEGMKLEVLSFSEERIARGIEIVRGMKSMQTIHMIGIGLKSSSSSPVEHWKAYDDRQKIIRLPKITEWRLLGPFPVAAPDPFPPESVALDREFPSGDKLVRWERFEAPRESGLVDLGTHFGVAGAVKAYAFAEITCSAEGEAIFGGGSDDSLILWVNGRKVHEDLGVHYYAPSGFSVRARLHAGKNTVLVRCGNGEGDWKFSVGWAPDP